MPSPSAAARLAEDLAALCGHLEYPLRPRKRLRSTNLLERSLEEVKRRTNVIGRFLGETICLSLCLAVLDLFIASARGLPLAALEHRQLAEMRRPQGCDARGADRIKMSPLRKQYRHISSRCWTRPPVLALAGRRPPFRDDRVRRPFVKHLGRRRTVGAASS
jgi:hypothetical protein